MGIFNAVVILKLIEEGKDYSHLVGGLTKNQIEFLKRKSKESKKEINLEKKKVPHGDK